MSGLTAWAPLAAETSELVEGLRAGLVRVETASGQGSGVVWDRQGWVVTNHHVVSGERARVELADGRRLDAVLVARDRPSDLALLRVDAADLAAVPAGDSRALRVGELVVAVGNPWGVRGTATLGIVSGLGRLPGGGRSAPEMLQADVALAPGNSGGPLADAQGRVVGIACMILAPDRALAIPIHVVRGFVEACGRKRAALA